MACSQAVSIVFFTETWRPDSFYHKIVANQRLGLHTLCLLDIQVREPDLAALARGKKVRPLPLPVLTLYCLAAADLACMLQHWGCAHQCSLKPG